MKTIAIFLIIFISLCIVDPLGDKTPKIEDSFIEAGGSNMVKTNIYQDLPLTGCRNPNTVAVYCKDCNVFNLKCTISMIPTFSCNDTLYLCSPEKDELAVNDIIAFNGVEPFNSTEYIEGVAHQIEVTKNFYIMHRIVGITEEGYITKGDNSEIDNFVIPFEDVFGKVYKIEKNTYKTTKTILLIET